MRKVAFLVDGDFYIRRYQSLHQGMKSCDDVETVARALMEQCLRHLDRARQEHLYRVFFYDCPPSRKRFHHPVTNIPIDMGKTSVAQFRFALHWQLKCQKNIALRLGVLDDVNGKWRIKLPEKERKVIAGKMSAKDLSESDVVYHAQQKGVDMKLGLDMASLAYKKLVDKVVLVSGDSDFVPAAKLVRREGIEVVLDPMGHTVKESLLEHVDDLKSPYLPKSEETLINSGFSQNESEEITATAP